MYISSILKSKTFNILFICALFFTIGAFPTKVFSQENKSEGTEKKFDPKETILEHIADKHEWRLFGKSYIPLPVILYTDKGIEAFSSANLQPAGTIYKGKYYNYILVNNKIKAVGDAGKIDVAANKKVGKAPKGLQSFLEPLILFIRDDVALPNIGVKYERYMPLLLTIFFFILINNLFGMIPFFPGGYNLTGNIAVTLTLAVIILFVVNLNAKKGYWKHIFVPNPWWLFPIMIPVEIVSIFSKPIALMIRLFANITAGHIIVLSLVSLIFIFNSLWISPVSVVFVVFIDTIELLVAFLQAYIFTMLSSLFIGMAIEEHHDHQEVI